MNELMERLSEVPGLEESQRQEVAAVLLRMADEHFSAAVKQPLFASIGGPDGVPPLALERPAPPGGIEAMMSGAMQNVLGVTDPLVSTLAALKATGLSASQSLLAGRAFLRFAGDTAGMDVVRQMADEIPGLSRLN